MYDGRLLVNLVESKVKVSFTLVAIVGGRVQNNFGGQLVEILLVILPNFQMSFYLFFYFFISLFILAFSNSGYEYILVFGSILLTL